MSPEGSTARRHQCSGAEFGWSESWPWSPAWSARPSSDPSWSASWERPGRPASPPAPNPLRPALAHLRFEDNRGQIGLDARLSFGFRGAGVAFEASGPVLYAGAGSLRMRVVGGAEMDSTYRGGSQVTRSRSASGPDRPVEEGGVPDQGSESRGDSGSDEDHTERVNRELIELLNELRVALPGTQVLFAFLLAVPFAQGFTRTTDFQRALFFVVMALTAISRRCSWRLRLGTACGFVSRTRSGSYAPPNGRRSRKSASWAWR